MGLVSGTAELWCPATAAPPTDDSRRLPIAKLFEIGECVPCAQTDSLFRFRLKLKKRDGSRVQIVNAADHLHAFFLNAWGKNWL